MGWCEGGGGGAVRERGREKVYEITRRVVMSSDSVDKEGSAN